MTVQQQWLVWGITVLLALASLPAAGDGSDGNTGNITLAPAIVAKAEAVAYPRTLTDGAGRTVKITVKPSRIVSLSPAITEMVLALGAGNSLVGVTRYCIVPDKEPPVARVGGVLDPDYEQIVAVRPDLVLVPYLASKELFEKLESLGLTVVVLNPEGLDNLPRDFRLAGQATGEDTKGAELAGQFEQLRAVVRQRLADLPVDQRPTAVMLYGDDLLAPAPGGFAGQLLDEAGARNAIPGGGRAWVELSAEGLLKINPDIILLVRDSTKVAWPSAAQPALQGLSAVEKGKVIDLPESLFIRPGMLQGSALWYLAHQLHPKRFPEASWDKAGQPAVSKQSSSPR